MGVFQIAQAAQVHVSLRHLLFGQVHPYDKCLLKQIEQLFRLSPALTRVDLTICEKLRTTREWCDQLSAELQLAHSTHAIRSRTDKEARHIHQVRQRAAIRRQAITIGRNLVLEAQVDARALQLQLQVLQQMFPEGTVG